MVIGSGGREHAIIRALKKSPEIDRLYCLPGNGGIAADAVCVDISAKDIAGMVEFSKSHAIDFAVVAPDDPLVLGAVDALQEVGVACFGPNRRAAIIEGSKAFAKDLMKRYGIPTADYAVFSDFSVACAYIRKCTPPVVVKADGLALGKGVVIAETQEDAIQAAREMMQEHKFGDSGLHVVIEEFLTGPEVSVLAFTDGKTLVPMVSSMDHKRAEDGDRGLNTGGMGTIAPNPCYTPEIAEECMQKIFLPTIRAMAQEGRPFKGCLYFGLMLTAQGPRVIEYNCRFGDPETQVVLPLLKTDLFSIFRAVSEERLADITVEFSSGSCCCVVMASRGYPAGYETGYDLSISPEILEKCYIAGARLENGRLKTSGGRVLGVTGCGDTLLQAVEEAYKNTKMVHFENAYCRRDIGKRALEA